MGILCHEHAHRTTDCSVHDKRRRLVLHFHLSHQRPVHLGVDEGDKDVTGSLCGLHSLVEVGQATWEHQRPANAGLDKFATVAKEVDTAALENKTLGYSFVFQAKICCIR